MNPVFKGWRSYLLVEPPVMLYFFAQAVAVIVTTELIIERAHRALNEFSNSSHVNDTEGMQNETHHYVSQIIMYKSFIDGLIPAILSFFLGPWSDKYGRKPLLVASYAGSAISFLLWSILSSMILNPWWYLMASVPPALVGGYPSLILVTYSYITDITSERDRAWHLTWQQAVIPAGQIIGGIVAPFIFLKFGYTAVFGIASASGAIAMIYVLIFVPETIIREEAHCCSFFDTSLIRSMIDTCVKKRDGSDRVIIWCCIMILAIFMLVGEGELSIMYLFVSARLDWHIRKYAEYRMIVVILAVIGTLLSAKIFQNLVDESMANIKIAVFSISSLLAGAVAKSFSTQSLHFYLSTGLDMFGGISGPVVRAALSKSVPPQDAGKAFALATSMEAAIALASGPLYSNIYANYLPPYYPSPVFLLSAGFYALIIGLVITIDWRFKVKPRVITEDQSGTAREIN